MRPPQLALAEPLRSARTLLVLGVLAVLAALCALPAPAHALQFVQASGSPYGFGSADASDVASGDLNGDGRDDVVSVNWGSLFADEPAYSVMLAGADGSLTLAPGGAVPLTTEPYRVALGYLDGDSDLDMAMTMSNTVDVYFGNGDGSFTATPVASLTPGASPMGIAVADLDGDTREDIVVANYGSGSVSTFYASGEDGVFTQPPGSPFPVGATQPIAVAVGDLDGNGIADITTANQDETGVVEKSMSVLLAGEGGAYAPAPGSPLEGEYRSADIAIGHIDDGPTLDLVTVSNPNNGVVVKLGDGGGGFTDAPGGPFDFPSRLSDSLALADLNGDGRDEVSIPIGGSIGGTADDTVWVFESTDEGSLFVPEGGTLPVWPASSPDSIAAGDFDGDGTPDLVTANFSENLTVLLRNDEPQPDPVLEPGWLEFDELLVGESSEPQDVRIANEGSGPLSVFGIALSGEDPGQFTLDTSACGDHELEPGEECTAEVSFAPTSTGSMSAQLQIPRVLGPPALVSLYGEADDIASVELSPSEHDFGGIPVGEGPSGPKTFFLQSTSEAFMEIESVSITGADAEDFEISYDDCEGEHFWEEGDYCEVDVEFDPESVGEKSAELTIESEELAEPVTATLSGDGEANPGIIVFPEEWDAGGAPVGISGGPTERFGVLSYGGTPLEIGTVSLGGPDSGDFEIVEDGCSGESVDPYEECGIEVEFSPGSTGLKQAELEIPSNVPGSPEVALLEGSGEGVAAAALTPDSHDFGAVPYKTPSAAQAFTLENTGTEQLVITAATLTNTVDGFEIVANECLTTLDPDQSCAVEVLLNPQTFGPLSGELQFATNAPGVEPSATLSGSAANNPGIALTPSSHDFGEQLMGGKPGPIQTFTVESTGTTSLLLGMPGIGGADSADFDLDATDCDEAGSLEPGETCDLEVDFDPQTAGAKSAQLVMFSDAGEATAALSGFAAERKLSISPSGIGAGSVPIGDAVPTFLDLQNAGNVQVTVESLEFTGGDVSQFSIVEDCVGTLQTSTACSAQIDYEPTEAGEHEATLTIEADAPGGPWLVEYTGTGVAIPGISLTPSSHDFGNVIVGAGPSAGQTFTVESTGAADLNLGTIELAGADPGQFSLDQSCPATLAPEATCEVQVAFDPTSEGPKSAELSVASNAPSSPVTAGFGGVGIAPDPELEITPASHDFGGVPVGTESPTQTFSVESTGNVPVTIGNSGVATSGEAAGDFSAAADGCLGTELSPGETCAIEIGFEPLEIGTRNAELLVYSDGGGPPAATASLTGTGTANPAMTVSPASLAFGERTVGEGPSASQAVTIESSGTTPLEFEDVGITGAGVDQFELVDIECPSALPPGESCEAFVAFDPTAAGAHSAEFEVDAADSPGVATVALTGTGVAKPEPPAPPAPSAPAPPAVPPPTCPAPEVGQPTAFVPKVRDTPGVPGLRARFAIGAPAVLEVSAQLRYRADGRSRTVSLGKQTLQPGGSTANYKVAIPAHLRKALPPGAAVRLTLRYRSHAAGSACASFGPPQTKSLATKVVWIKPA